MQASTLVKERGLAASADELTGAGPGLVAYNLAYLALAWAVAAVAIAGFWLHPRWYTFVLAFLVVSSRQQALLNCEHEANHRKLLPSRAANDFVGTYLAAAAVGSPFGAATPGIWLTTGCWARTRTPIGCCTKGPTSAPEPAW